MVFSNSHDIFQALSSLSFISSFQPSCQEGEVVRRAVRKSDWTVKNCPETPKKLGSLMFLPLRSDFGARNGASDGQLVGSWAPRSPGCEALGIGSKRRRREDIREGEDRPTRKIRTIKKSTYIIYKIYIYVLYILYMYHIGNMKKIYRLIDSYICF